MVIYIQKNEKILEQLVKASGYSSIEDNGQIRIRGDYYVYCTRL